MAAAVARPTTAPTDISAMLGGQRVVKSFTAIPEEIQAIQFLGWESAQDIFSFADGFMYVGKGYGHKFRKPEESNRDKTGPLPESPEFLVFKVEGLEYRIDLGFWVVKKANGDTVIYANEQIKAHFTENMY